MKLLHLIIFACFLSVCLAASKRGRQIDESDLTRESDETNHDHDRDLRRKDGPSCDDFLNGVIPVFKNVIPVAYFTFLVFQIKYGPAYLIFTAVLMVIVVQLKYQNLKKISSNIRLLNGYYHGAFILFLGYLLRGFLGSFSGLIRGLLKIFVPEKSINQDLENGMSMLIALMISSAIAYIMPSNKGVGADLSWVSLAGLIFGALHFTIYYIFLASGAN